MSDAESCVYCDYLDMHEDGEHFCRYAERLVREPSNQTCNQFKLMRNYDGGDEP